ncbi:MAG: hypothetical protein AB7O24_28525 [Kofleriaceae bacterium]
MRVACVVVLLLIAPPVRAEQRCIGWAVAGGLGVAFVTTQATMGTMRLVGEDYNDGPHAKRNGWIIGSSMMVGASLGPVVTCGLAGDEAHSVPIATFMIAGASIAGVSSYLAARALHRDPDPGESESDMSARHEGEGLLDAMFIVLGSAAGGVGGYFLHKALFRAEPSTWTAQPLVSPELTGVGVAGRF